MKIRPPYFWFFSEEIPSLKELITDFCTDVTDFCTVVTDFCTVVTDFYTVVTDFCTVLQIFALFWVMFGINCTRINQSQPRNISLYIIKCIIVHILNIVIILCYGRSACSRYNLSFMSFILIKFTYYFKHIFIQYISVHFYKGPDFIPDRGPKIASPPLYGSI